MKRFLYRFFFPPKLFILFEKANPSGIRFCCGPCLGFWAVALVMDAAQESQSQRPLPTLPPTNDFLPGVHSHSGALDRGAEEQREPAAPHPPEGCWV